MTRTNTPSEIFQLHREIVYKLKHIQNKINNTKTTKNSL